MIAEALRALEDLQREAAARHLDTMTSDEIDTGIAAVRRERAAARG